jgi:uncharacterized secreted protein with C-terminal beta-propeller domain
MAMKTTLKQVLVVAGLLSLGLLAGCEEDKAPYSPLMNMDLGDKDLFTQHAALTAATSCEDAQAQFKSMLKTQMLMQLEQERRWRVEWATNPDKGWYGRMAEDGEASPSAGEEQNAAPGPSTDTSKEGAENYSETNVQTEGVDEADLVKTDGKFLYTLSGNQLVIVDAWPAQQAHEVSRVDIKGYPYSMFLDGTRLAILSSTSLSELDPAAQSEKQAEDYYWGYWQPATLVTIVDASDTAAPVVASQKVFEGYLVDSRRVGSRMYIVQQSYIDLWNEGVKYWADISYESSVSEINAAFFSLAVKNSEIIDGLDLDEYVPRMFDVSKQGTINTDEGTPVVGCTDMYSSDVYSGSGNLTVVTVDLTGVADPAGTAVMGDWGNVYASTKALYAASTNWAWSWWWETDDEDEAEINTHIHKFDFDDETGFAHYVASGTVTGYAIDQFAFDEYEGVLRVATTRPDWGWWNEDSNDSESFVSTLVQDGAALTLVGQVGQLGIGETIQSVRFIKDKGYVVTFRQTDPLYVVDLSVPEAPVVAGELKVPGFSSYIHPLDDTHLLTIGRDATEEGQVLGLAFQIFDVSDPSDPKQIAKTVLPEDQNGYSWSEAQWDHHAFVYFAHLGMLAIPVTGYNWDYEYSNNWDWYLDTYFSRLDLYRVSIDGGIVPAGSVSHGSMMPEFTAPEQKDNTYCYMNWNYSDLTQIRRGVFMENFLYSVSKGGVMVHDTEDIKAGPVAEVGFQDVESLQDMYGNVFECYTYDDYGYYEEE